MNDGGTSVIRRSGPQRIMSGILEDYPLPELLQFLRGMRKRVHLLIERSQPQQSAGIYFSAGRPIHAYLPPLTGDEAVLALLTWDHGRFMLIDDAVPEQESVKSDLQTLLLEGMRRLDESSRHLPIIPRPEMIPEPRTQFDSATDELLLTLREWRLLAAVDGRRTVTDLAHALHRAVPEVQRDLCNLSASGLVRLHGDKTA